MAAVRKRRRRRTAEEARRTILEVAETHLAAAGAEGVRLNAIAADLGVTHQAILRHFGSREELMRELLRRAARRMRDEVRAVATLPHGASASVEKLTEAAFATFGAYARLSASLVLAGKRMRGRGLFREAIEAIHAERPDAAQRDIDDTRFALLLVSLVGWSDALVGEAMQRATDLPGDARTSERFRAWLVEVLERHLFGGVHRSGMGSLASKT